MARSAARFETYPLRSGPDCHRCFRLPVAESRPISAANAAEKSKWAKLWSLPQPVEWERMRCEDLVALYCRVLVAVSSKIDTRLLPELRHLDAKIGLSPRALLDLRWEIDEAVLEEPFLEENDHLAFVPDHRDENGWYG